MYRTEQTHQSLTSALKLGSEEVPPQLNGGSTILQLYIIVHLRGPRVIDKTSALKGTCR